MVPEHLQGAIKGFVSTLYSSSRQILHVYSVPGVGCSSCYSLLLPA